MWAKFGCGPMVVSKKGGGGVQTDRQRKLQLYIVDSSNRREPDLVWYVRSGANVTCFSGFASRSAFRLSIPPLGCTTLYDRGWHAACVDHLFDVAFDSTPVDTHVRAHRRVFSMP